MTRRIDKFGKPQLFRGIDRGKSNLSFTTGSIADIYNTNIRSDDSFRYDPHSSPLKSTQQLSVDYSRFENHTFFNSATAKTTVAFNKIVNKYPFDGTLEEIETFEDKLTGYEKYILDIFPKHTGFITNTGSMYISVKNIAGSTFPEFSSQKTAKKALDPGYNSISFESFVRIPGNETLSKRNIFDISGPDNIVLKAYTNSATSGDDNISVYFSYQSGSYKTLVQSSNFPRDEWQHLSFVIDKNHASDQMKIFVNGNEQSTSQNIHSKNIIFSSDLNIMKSSTEHDNTTSTGYFSGSVKDFRVYHRARNQNEILNDYKKTVYGNDYLKLNFRFNEPTASYAISEYALDTSGQSLHSKIENYHYELRLTSSISNPVTGENTSRNHVLFPDYEPTQILNTRLINSGSDYDDVNPNLITKLVPPHYFENSIFEDGNSDEISTFSTNVTGSSVPGSANPLNTGVLTVLLLSWAHVFDEIKMYIDAFGNIIFSDYNDVDIVPDQLISFAAKQLGVDLPPIFTDDNSESFFNTTDPFNQTSVTRQSKKKIQSIIWKRILADANYYKRTKGTLESLKSIFRSSGIEPDKFFTFVERGSNTHYLSDNFYEEKVIQIPLVNFSGSLVDNDTFPSSSIDRFGFSSDRPHFVSSLMSGSMYNTRIFPTASIETAAENEMFTSGSWAFEGYYKFDNNSTVPVTQSLARIQRYTEFESIGSNSLGGILNLVALKNQNTSLTSSNDSVKAYFTSDSRPDTVRQIELTDTNIFDGNLWYVSFAKTREDDPKNKSLSVGDKYTLACARYGSGNLLTTSSFLIGSSYSSNGDVNIQKETYDYISGLTEPQIVIGQQSLAFGTSYGIHRSDNDEIDYTDFSGKIGSLRFWSKSLTDREMISHSNNIDDYGTEAPILNSMFVPTGSEIIRLNVNANQVITSSNATKIIAIDRTQREDTITHASKSFFYGFENNKSINSFDKFKFLSFPNKIDEINSSNKVRINSLENDVDNDYQFVTPVYDILNSNIINDDARFSIEMSIARLLNDEINNEVATVKFYENAVGTLNNVFGYDYPDLNRFSQYFFNNSLLYITGNNII